MSVNQWASKASSNMPMMAIIANRPFASSALSCLFLAKCLTQTSMQRANLCAVLLAGSWMELPNPTLPRPKLPLP